MVITRTNYPRLVNKDDNPEFDMFIKQQGHIWDRSTTLQTDCIADQLAMADFNFYTTRELDQLKTGAITYEYFRISVITRFIKKYYLLFDNKEWSNRSQHLVAYALPGAMLDLYDWYINQKLGSIGAISSLADVMLPQLKDQIDIQSWATRRINERATIIGKLLDILTLYYSYLHITKKEADRLYDQVRHEKFNDLRDVFRILNPTLYSNRLCFWNGSTLGLGSILFSLSVKNNGPHSRVLQGWKEGLLDSGYCDLLLYYTIMYDLTIVTHGDDMIVTNNDWFIQPVKSPFDGKTYHSVSKLLTAIRNTTDYKRVNVLACNPNKVKVDPALYNDTDYLVNIHEGNVFIG